MTAALWGAIGGVLLSSSFWLWVVDRQFKACEEPMRESAETAASRPVVVVVGDTTSAGWVQPKPHLRSVR